MPIFDEPDVELVQFRSNNIQLPRDSRMLDKSPAQFKDIRFRTVNWNLTLILPIINTVLYAIDVYSDIALAITYYNAHDYWYEANP